jgi:hypothetical protein
MAGGGYKHKMSKRGKLEVLKAMSLDMYDCLWVDSHRADKESAKIADRHYNRQKVGSPQFVPPGRCKVFKGNGFPAVWVTSWPFAQYVKHQWGGAWVNSLFRNESYIPSSLLILCAVIKTSTMWKPPDLGIITFVNTKKIRSVNPGCCYKHAGFTHVGYTKGGLMAFQLLPKDFTYAT